MLLRFAQRARKLALIAAPLALAVACEEPGKVTGGGTLDSAGGPGKSTFAFNASSCPDANGEPTLKGKVNYIDRTAIDFEDVGGVTFHGDVTNAFFCSNDAASGIPCNCGLTFSSGGMYEIQFDYSSRNNGAPGEGEGIICAFDFGQGRGLHGAVLVAALSGPFEGYQNFSSVSGNVKSHSCDTPDEEISG